LLSLFANIFAGHTPEKYVFVNDKSNEVGGSQKHSQTRFAKLYEFTSKNGIKFRILDTPGLADTRGIAQDERHKTSIVEAITNTIPYVNAVLILANGTLPRLGAATDYALWSLSSMFPRSLAESIAILLTNVPNALTCNFSQEALPDGLKGPNFHPFFIDNPVALWKKYKELRPEQNPSVSQDEVDEIKKDVRRSHRKVLKEMVKFFDWIVDLKPQPTRGIQTLYQESQEIERCIADALSRATQLENKKKELKEGLELAARYKLTMEEYKKYETVVTNRIWVHSATPATHNSLCEKPECYSNCHIDCFLEFSLEPESLLYCEVMEEDDNCKKCGHSYQDHRHYKSLWKQEDRTEVVLDEQFKQKFLEARAGEGRLKEMKIGLERAIKGLDEGLNKSLDEIASHTEAYVKLALTGSFTALIKRTVRLLETTSEAMRNNKADVATVRVVEESLTSVKMKLELVTNAAKRKQINS
jgi:hypothetical protein